jgi:hypothetical protein
MRQSVVDSAPGAGRDKRRRSTNQEAIVSLSAQFLNSSDAASRLGVSVKALRLYELRGLITPISTEAGWRSYGPDEMSSAT